jgi:hypothetical protein
MKVFKMIEIFNESKGKLGFQSYNSLFRHIREIEKEKLLETGQMDWSFVIHSNERLSGTYWSAVKALEIFLTPKEQEAYETGLNLLEIWKGDPDNPYQIILTPDVNVKEIKKSWCRDYCIENGYTVCEVDG